VKEVFPQGSSAHYKLPPKGGWDMNSTARIRLNKIQREAEGYLELGLGRQALAAVERLGNPAEFGPTTLYLWGESLRSVERYEEAIAPLTQAVQADGENIHIWLALGWCYKRTGRIEMAIGALEKALLADPNEALLHYNLACYLSLARQKDGALDHLSRALSIEPRYRELIEAEADFAPLRSDPDFQALTGSFV
jgi:tetratricopeptide (TPR) repeat protein